MWRAAAALGALAASAAAPAEAANILLKVNYEVTADTPLYGRQTVADEVQFRLHGRDMTVFKNGQQIGSTAQSSDGDFYGPVTMTSRVVGGKLVLNAIARTHTIALTVSTDGKSTCKGNGSVVKRPGADSIVVVFPPAGAIAVNSIKIDHLVCSLSTEN